MANNNSDKISDWTNKKLKEEAKSYYQSIYQLECFGTSDLRVYASICDELEKRGIEMQTGLYFN